MRSLMKATTPSTLTRYTAGILPATLLLNFALNYLIGWAIYGGWPQIPVLGAASILADTVISTFLIAFFSFLATVPGARREARAGRIPGCGRAGFFLWLERHSGAGGVLFAVVLTPLLSWGVYLFFSMQDIAQISGSSFLWFKGVYSGVLGGFATWVAALLAVQSAPLPYVDPRWCRNPDPETDGLTYPCDYLDKGCLTLTNEEKGLSCTPTWHLVVEGTLDPAHVKAAIADLVTRYPSLAMLMQSLDGHPEYARQFRYATNPDFALEPMFEEVDLTTSKEPEDALAKLLQEHRNRHTDPFRDPPMTVTLVHTAKDHCLLLFRQYHGYADGRAFIELLEDFALYLNAAIAGNRPSEEQLEPIHRIPEKEALGLNEEDTKKLTSAGFNWFVGSLIRQYLKPTTHFLQNESGDYTGGNNSLHWVISDQTLDAWKPERRRHEVSLNSLLMAAILDANRRWHQEMGRPLGKTLATMAMETRPRDGGFRSFANHLAILEVTLQLDQDTPTPALARSIQAQVIEQRDTQQPTKRLLIEQKVVESLSLDQLQAQIIHRPNASDNISFSNLIPLHIPSLEGNEWKVEEILITTPVGPRHGLGVTVIRYQGKLIFNLNYKETTVTREEAATLLAHIQASIAEVTGHSPDALPSAQVVVPPMPVVEPVIDPATLPMIERPSWRAFLARPASVWSWVLLAMLLTLPTLFIGFVLDDQLQKLKVQGQQSPHFSASRPLDLFHFISEDNRKALIESGAYPWWTAPKLQLAFFRPVSSATHWLDYKVWPDLPVFMHLQSLFWLALLILLASVMYRGFLTTPWVAGLAGLMYAIDESHGLGIGFLANRNALIATSFAVAVLLVHHRWRRDGWALGVILGPLLLALGLCAGEFALFVTAYLFAYSMFLDPARSWKRFVPLAPYVAVVVGWRIMYKMLGYGAFQSGAYIDPLGEPVRFVLAMLERFPTLLLATWTPATADFWMTNSHTMNIVQAAIGALILGLIGWAYVPLLRLNATARFWALGMLLATLPICATFPHDRILFGVGIGAMGLIAQLIGFRYHAYHAQEVATGEGTKAADIDMMGGRRLPVRSWGVRFLVSFFIVAHVYMAALFLPLKASAPLFLGKLEAKAYRSLPKTADIKHKKVMLLHSPGFLSHTIFAMNAMANKPQPKSLCQLSISLKPLDVFRVDSHTLKLKAGDALVDRSTRFLVRTTSLPFRVGQVIRYNDITVTVTKLGKSGRPSEATFRFDQALSDSSYIWMVWKGAGYVPFTLPAIGQSKRVAPIAVTDIFW